MESKTFSMEADKMGNNPDHHGFACRQTHRLTHELQGRCQGKKATLSFTRSLRRIRLAFLLALFPVIWVSCIRVDPFHIIRGSGRIVEEFREVGQFDRVKVVGSCKLFIRSGPGGAIRLLGEDNILPLIETTVVNRTLVIATSNECSYLTNVGVEVHVSMNTVRGLSIAGSCIALGEGRLSADTLELEIAGSGRIDLDVAARDISSRILGSGTIELHGECDRHVVEITGSGNMRAFDLQAKQCDIVISGSGECRVFVTSALDVRISGSATVYYKGRPPFIRLKNTGTGKIIALD
jgi:hypothetical protein